MAINSVSSTSSTAQLQAAKTQMETQAARPRDENTKASEVQPPKRMEAPERSERSPESAEQPKPVVNAQGQKTGTIINTSA